MIAGPGRPNAAAAFAHRFRLRGTRSGTAWGTGLRGILGRIIADGAQRLGLIAFAAAGRYKRHRQHED
jgi:hypothetical protein